MDPSIDREKALDSLQDFVNALNSSGQGLLAQRFNDDVVWRSDLLQPRGNRSGSGSVSEELLRLRDLFKSLIVTIDTDSILFDGGRVSFHFTVKGDSAQFIPGIGATGRNVHFRGSATVAFDSDGRVIQLTTTWNCARVLGQLGMRSYARPGPV